MPLRLSPLGWRWNQQRKMPKSSGLRHLPANHNSWERESGGVQSAGVSQRVRVTGRDESQSVPSPEKLLKTWDLELPNFLRDLSQVVRRTPRDTPVCLCTPVLSRCQNRKWGSRTFGAALGNLVCEPLSSKWGEPKQPIKLQQPRNYDFGMFQFNLLGSQAGNSREMTTSPPGHHGERQQLHSQQPPNYRKSKPTAVK